MFDYAKQTAYDEGNTAGTITGIAKGEIKKTFEIAKVLKVQGFSIEIITKATGLLEIEIDLL